MSTYPRLEARISAQERQQIILNARIEELSEDMTANINQLSDDMKASFKQLATYQIEMEHHIDTRFAQVNAHLDQTDAQFKQVNARLDNVETLLTQILARLPEQPS